MKKVVIIDAFPDDFPVRIRALGCEVVFAPDCSPAEAIRLLADAHVLVINSKIRVEESTVGAAKNLSLVCRAGVGLDHMDLPYLQSRGIKVFNTPGANSVPVAEQAIGMLLALLHRIIPANAEVKAARWLREKNRGEELMGKTLGIIGYGNIGSALAQRLSGFGLKVLAYDKYKSGFGGPFAEEVEMEVIFSQADILSLHVPLSSETRCLVDENYLSRFSRPIWLLNLSRGEVVKTNALVQALKTGKVKGAGLDVLENEKLETLNSEQKEAFQALSAMKNVILTPHIGGWSFESLERINSSIISEIAAHMKG